MPTIDLREQVKKVLRRINGGTDNDQGWSEGVVQRYNNNTGSAIPIGSLVSLRTGGTSNFVELSATEEGDDLVGIVKGTYVGYGPTIGQFELSAPSNDQEVAVMTAGTTYVLTTGTVTKGEYAYVSATAGMAKSDPLKKRGAFGRYVSSGSNSAFVRLPLTGIFTGSEIVQQYEGQYVSDLVRLDFSSGFALHSNSASTLAAIDLAYEQFELDAQQIKVANSSNYFNANLPSTGIETLRPTGDFLKSGTITYSSGSTGWNLVDESVLDTSDNYYFHTTSPTYLIHSFPASALTNKNRITSIRLVPDTTNSAPANSGFVRIRDPQTAEVYDVQSIGQNSASNAGVVTLTTRPWDGRPWTVDDMRHLQVGFYQSGTMNLRVRQFYVEVNYTIPVTVEQALNQVGSVAASATHNILSATHSDTLSATVVRGDLVRGNATPKWERLPVSGSSPSNAVLVTDGTDTYWRWPAPVDRITASGSNILWGQVDLRPGSNMTLSVSSNTITFNAGAGGSGGGINSGTAFPGGPSNNDLFYRTDLDLLFFYDGTRWMTVNIYTQTLPIFTSAAIGANISATTASYERSFTPPLQGGSDIYLLTFESKSHINTGTALSASHKWVGTLDKTDSANAATTIATISYDSGSDNVWRTGSNTINALQNNGTTYYNFNVTWTKTGTPGAFQSFDAITYRIVAT